MPSAKDMKLLALIATLAVAGASAYLLFAGGGGGGNGRAVPIVWTLPTVTAPAADPPSPESQSTRKSHGPSFPIATLVAGHRIALHTSPAGTVFKQVGDRTEFGSTRAYWIERVRGGWFGVPTPDLPNGRLAWIRDDRSDLTISQTHFWITAVLSAHRLQL